MIRSISILAVVCLAIASMAVAGEYPPDTCGVPAPEWCIPGICDVCYMTGEGVPTKHVTDPLNCGSPFSYDKCFWVPDDPETWLPDDPEEAYVFWLDAFRPFRIGA